jgi:poly-gamma-glutamate capsule biosynthesis protein CapA/YwtB (metallophosphatase superfamily)
VASALKAPIVFANLEGTMTTGSSGKCAPGSTSCYAFSVPPSYAAIMHDAGFNVLNSANNHSHDFGDQGAADTSAALKAAGIEQTGLPGQIAVNDAGGTKVATIGFAPYSNVNNLLDLPTAKALIAKAKTLAPLVVVYMHAGAEGATATHVTGSEETYVGEDRGNAKAFAHAAIDAGADLVIGSGPHVVRGMEWYQGKLIAYSLGNFANYQNFASSGTMALSAILRVTLDADGTFKSGVLTSVLLSSTGQPAVDSTGQAASLMNQLSTADFGSSAATIQPDGSIAPPATP